MEFLTIGKLKEIIKDVPDDYKIEYVGDYCYEYMGFCIVEDERKLIQVGSF